MLSDWDKQEFTLRLTRVAQEIHETALAKGWWDAPRNDGEVIALCHSELSEALEAIRHGNPLDQHCPEFTSVEIELADVIIRILDYAYQRGHALAPAILAKMEFNETRPHKHGGKAF